MKAFGELYRPITGNLRQRRLRAAAVPTGANCHQESWCSAGPVFEMQGDMPQAPYACTVMFGLAVTEITPPHVHMHLHTFVNTG